MSVRLQGKRYLAEETVPSKRYLKPLSLQGSSADAAGFDDDEMASRVASYDLKSRYGARGALDRGQAGE